MQIYTPNKSWDFLQWTYPFSCPERTSYDDQGVTVRRYTNMAETKQRHDVKMDGETDGHLHSGRLVRLEVYKVFISHLLAVNAKRDCRDKFE